MLNFGNVYIYYENSCQKARAHFLLVLPYYYLGSHFLQVDIYLNSVRFL